MPDAQDLPAIADDLALEIPSGTPVEHVITTEEADLDGDGRIDAVTETEVMGFDTDGDGKVDTVVRAQTTIVDIDGDAVTDMAHRTETVLVDLDGDGTPDIGRQVEVLAFDSTGDGELDEVHVTHREGFVQHGEIVDPQDALDEIEPLQP
jgi:hypothetical protein